MRVVVRVDDSEVLDVVDRVADDETVTVAVTVRVLVAEAVVLCV